ncbi:MAG: PD40 domain-containing protein [Phycisphaerae bacterium]|nr:PD40 domain-containing protein [Phycisphaerae bacterium]
MQAVNRTGMGLVAILAFGTLAGATEIQHLMRYADVHGDAIVFTYEGDLWLASTNGGEARRITRHPGNEYGAKFSPDGTQLAFTAQYDGGTDVYVMDARGGEPKRLTFHPAPDVVADWFPDGKHVLFRSRREYSPRTEQLYQVSAEGGMAEKLPVDRGGLASVSADGEQIAYNRIPRELKTWKRHKGGTAQDIWIGRLKDRDYQRATDWPGTDSFPMWHGSAVCFLSDRLYGTLNLYRLDPATLKVTPLTEYRDYDVKFPSIGSDQIVYQYGESLHLLDLKTGQSRPVPITIRSDRIQMRAEPVAVAPSTGSFGLSPNGKRLLLEARGEILNVPVEDGVPVRVTQASGSHEKNAAWSPDGKWIVFLSDRTGNEEFYLADAKGEQSLRQLTSGGTGFRMQPVWSPDSRWILFSDKFMRLNLLNAEAGDLSVIDQGLYDDGWERWGIQDYVWSPDSRWVAYTKLEESGYESIFLYGLDARQTHRVTDDTTEDWSPSFDPKGRYLYFLSNRTFKPRMGWVDQNHVFLDMARPYAVLLKAGEPSPFDLKEEEAAETQPTPATAAADKADDESGEKAKKGKDEKTDTRIDLDGIGRRVVAIEGVEAGNYFRLEAADSGFLYLAKTQPEFSKYQSVTDRTGGKLDLHHYNLEDKETSRILSGIANYHVSADGKKLVYRAGSRYGVIDTGKKADVGDGEVDLKDVYIEVDRLAEFRQMFDEAWRIQRDWFYDSNLHGEDWEAVGAKYRRFVPACGNRQDLTYVIGEMIAELNAGHTYVYGGDVQESAERIPTGLLGAEFETVPDASFYRICHIIPGTPGNESERSPLDVPGRTVRAGQYLIAIDEQEVRVGDNVYRHLQNKPDTWITLTFNDQPSPDGAETCRVKTIGSEKSIRYREWVDNNRAFVEKQTDGKVGYLHVPDMGDDGLIEFARAFYPQCYKKALIIDERYNGGGFTADMIIDRLERRVWAMTIPREGRPQANPVRGFHGHLIVLVNEETGSCGEFFAEAVQRKNIAPVLGVRTWGGSVGIEPHQNLVDGGTVTPPQFGLYGLDGKWLIEGHGVDPDIEVMNMPGDVVAGKDAQLEAAVQNMLQRLAEDPMDLPPVPEYPIKTKETGPGGA